MSGNERIPAICGRLMNAVEKFNIPNAVLKHGLFAYASQVAIVAAENGYTTRILFIALQSVKEVNRDFQFISAIKRSS